MRERRATLRIHVLQVGYGDTETVEQRVNRVVQLVAEQRGADVIVLPELWPHGGFAWREWAERAEGVDGPVMHALAGAARQAGAVVHAGSIVERSTIERGPRAGRRGLWNTSVVLSADGEVLATYRKIHRFGFGDGEPLVLEPGDEPRTVTIERPGAAVRAGLATCYDLRFPELFRQLLDAGAQLFLVPAAWPAARVEHWTLLGRARAIENQAFVVQCNTAGRHSGLQMGGCSQIVSPTGEVLARAGTQEQVLVAGIDLRDVEAYRQAFPVLPDRRL